MNAEQRAAYHAALIAAILAALLWEHHHLAIRSCVGRWLNGPGVPQAPLASVQMPRQWAGPPAAAGQYPQRVVGGGF